MPTDTQRKNCFTDTDRINFIENQLDRGGFKCEGGANTHGQPQFDPVEIFTVITQHIQAKSLREVLDKAIEIERSSK